MNLALIDVQSRNLLPEHIQYDIRDDGFARCASFNRPATLLAAGCSDGRVVVYDFATRGIVKIFVGHVQPVTVICWSRNSRRLLTASGDSNVVVWNVESGTKAAHLKFESPITSAQLHPRGKNVCLVSSQLSDAVEINLDTLERTLIPIANLPSSNASHHSPNAAAISHSPTPTPPPQSTEDLTAVEATATSDAKPTESANDSPPPVVSTPAPSSSNDTITATTSNSMDTSGNTTTSATPASTLSKSPLSGTVVAGSSNPFSPIAIYCPHGTEIFVGDSRGLVTIVDFETKTIKTSFRVATNANVGVKGLVVSSDKKRLLVNSSDRYMRLFNLPATTKVDSSTSSSTGPSGATSITATPMVTLLNPVPELHKELIDAVNKQQWKTMIFSPDNELVLAGASHRHEHRIYFFNVYNGRLLKNLEGPKEGILDLTWHPTLPILVTVSTAGTIYVWGAHQEESWSAFTPGFTELEKNEEYIEREDEFDAEDPTDNAAPRKKPKLTETSEDEYIDILSTEDIHGDSGDEHDESDLPDLIGLAKNVIPDKYLPSISQYPTLPT